MRDRYSDLVNSGPGSRLAGMLGLPRPVQLRRYATGQPLLAGPALVKGVGGGPLLPHIRRILASAAADVIAAEVASYDCRLGAVVIDVSDARAVDDLESLRAVLAPSLRRLDDCARIVLVGTPPESLTDPAAAATQRALEGIVRSVAKELRAGATANLIYAAQGAGPALESPLRFLLSARSAYVDGQVIRVASAAVTPPA